MFESGFLAKTIDKVNDRGQKKLLVDTLRNVDRFVDSRLLSEERHGPYWNAYYLSDFLQAISKNNRKEWTYSFGYIALKILCTLKMDAPWLFEQVPQADLRTFVNYAKDGYRQQLLMN